MQHYAGQYYHVYNRGTNRQLIFTSDENYRFLLRRVKQFLPLYPIRIISYVLMPNHYHFQVGVDGALAPLFQRLFNSYSQAFNRQQNRTGTLFEGRAKSVIVEDSSYVYALVRYIHLNPVMARLVSAPQNWEFSNYQEWIGVRNDELFDPGFRDVLFASPEEYRKYAVSDISDAMERKLARFYFD